MTALRTSLPRAEPQLNLHRRNSQEALDLSWTLYYPCSPLKRPCQCIFRFLSSVRQFHMEPSRDLKDGASGLLQRLFPDSGKMKLSNLAAVVVIVCCIPKTGECWRTPTPFLEGTEYHHHPNYLVQCSRLLLGTRHKACTMSPTLFY